jgi:hypothetical protein
MKLYQVVFNRNVYSDERVYGIRPLIFRKGRKFTINEIQFELLKKGETLKGSQSQGHGVSVGWEFSKNDVSEVFDMSPTPVSF